MKIHVTAALLALAISISTSSIAATRNGYRLVFIDLSTTKNSETSGQLKSYFNSELPPDTYRCAQGKRLIEFDLVYMNKRPTTITNDLVASSLQADKGSLKKIRKALRAYRDSKLGKGFDGLVVFRNEGENYELTTLSSIDHGYERSSKVKMHPKINTNTLKGLFCDSLAHLPYAYID